MTTQGRRSAGGVWPLAMRGLGLLVMLALVGCSSHASSARSRAATVAPAEGQSTTSRPAASESASPSVADQAAAITRLAALHRPIYCAGRRGRLVALTFDDGPGSYTHLALRSLRRAGASATFFLVGENIARFPEAAVAERDLGAIGDHTMTHANLAKLSTSAAMTELREGRNAILRAVGPPVDLVRPPFGAHTRALDRRISDAGMLQVMWDVDSQDSRVSPPANYREISANVRRAIRPGSIVLMHENRGQTVRALRGILPALRRRGLRSVSVPELLAADPPTTQQVRAARSGC